MALLIGDLRKRWLNNVIPFEITDDFLLNDEAKNLLDSAITLWNGSCKVKLVGHSNERDFVLFRRDLFGPCNSPVGRQGGEQFVSCFFQLEDSTFDDARGSIMHEIGHAVGLHHEQQRADRDNFVVVERSVQNSVNYRIEGGGAIYTPYDCGSIMHYPTIFGEIHVKPGQCPDGIGQRLGLSPFDVAALNGLALDANPQNISLAVNAENLYLLHQDGDVFQYNSHFRRWDKIDSNDDNKQFVADEQQLYLRHGDGGVFVYTGTAFQWQKIDANGDNEQIAASGGHLYLRHGDGGVFIYTGTPFQWEKIDSNDDNQQIVADGDRLYLRHGDGGVFIYTGTPFRWEKIDANGDNEQITAGGGKLYLRHGDGGVFIYTGTPFQWEKIDANGDNEEIAVSGNNLYLRHSNGDIFRYLGNPFQWQKLHSGATNVAMVPHEDRLYLIRTIFVTGGLESGTIPILSETTLGYHVSLSSLFEFLGSGSLA